MAIDFIARLVPRTKHVRLTPEAQTIKDSLDAATRRAFVPQAIDAAHQPRVDVAPPRPIAHPLVAMLPDAAWTDAANAIGYAPPFLAEEEFKATLAGLGVAAYDWAEVTAYMNATVAKLNAAGGRSAFRGDAWIWRCLPLREADARRFNAIPSSVMLNPYAHPVPLHALQFVRRVLDVLPDAYFSDGDRAAAEGGPVPLRPARPVPAAGLRGRPVGRAEFHRPRDGGAVVSAEPATTATEALNDLFASSPLQRETLLRGKAWRQRCVEARARGGFTREDRMLAYTWHSCAVGEQQLRMPEVRLLEAGGMVAAAALERLGGSTMGFTHAVLRDEVAAAEALLDAIEDRALALKREARS